MKKLAIIVLFLLTLMSLAFADIIQNRQNETHIDVQKVDNILNVSVLVFPAETSQPGFTTQDEVQKIIDSPTCQMDPLGIQHCLSTTSYNNLNVLALNQQIPTTVAYDQSNPNSRVITLTYLSSTGSYIPLPGCENLKLDQSQPYNLPYVTVTVIYNYGTCTINFADPGLIALNTILVRATFVPNGDPTLQFAQRDLPLDNPDSTPSSPNQFTNNLNNLFASVSSSGTACKTGQNGVSACNVVGPGALPCFGVFLILGLLLASMYFAGKSPISLLDITSPKLPTPKGVVAGGQILGPFGYTELKNATKMKLGAAQKAIDASLKVLTANRSISAAHQSLINRVNANKGTFADRMAEDVHLQKPIAAGLIAGGNLLGIPATRLDILSRNLPYKWGQDEHKLAAEIIKKLELRGGRHAVLALTIKDGLLGIRTFQSLEVLTGHFKTGERGLKSGAYHAFTTRFLGKAFGANRYAILSGIVMSGTDSAFRSTWLIKRATQGALTTAPALVLGIAKNLPVVKGATRAAVGYVERYVDRKAPTSRTFRTISGLLNPQIEVGQMFPVLDKMAHHYQTLRDEVMRDEMRYVLRQIYRKMGLTFDLSHGVLNTEQVMQTMGHIDMDIVARSGYHTIDQARLREIEERIRIILSRRTDVDPATMNPLNDHDKYVAEQQKVRELIKFAQSPLIHAVIRPEVERLQNFLESTNNSTQPEYIKMLNLTAHLDLLNNDRTAANKHALGANPDDFHCYVGGATFRDKAMWATHVLRTMIYDAEHGYLTKGFGSPTETAVEFDKRIREGGGIKQELISARLNIANRLASLDPLARENIKRNQGPQGYLQLPDYMQNVDELEKVRVRNRSELIQLFTKEGLEHFQQVKKKDMKSAALYEIIEFMYGGKTPGHGTQIDAEGNKSKTGKMVWWVAESELGLPENNAFVDVKRQWFDRLTSRENIALSQWTESRFTRGYAAPFKGSIEAELDRDPASGSWSSEQRSTLAKQKWIRDLLVQDMEQRFNSTYALNTYGDTHETTRLYTGIVAGFLEKYLRNNGRTDGDHAIDFLTHLDTDNRTQRAELLTHINANRKGFEEMIYERNADGTLGAPKKVHESDISGGKNVLVMLQEGGYAYYKKGMILSDQDRLLGGEMAIHDGEGQLRKFDPSDIAITEKKIGTKLYQDWENLRQSYSKYTVQAEAEHPGGIPAGAAWTPFLTELRTWANTNAPDRFERQKILAAVLWEYGSRTHDYAKFWHECDVSVHAKREVTPLAPGILRHIGLGDTSAGDYAASGMQHIRDLALPVGDWFTRVALLAGGELLRTSYDIVPTSEYYRQHSMKMAARIYSGEFEKGQAAEALSEEEKKAYRGVAMAHHAYHQVWDYAIDRHPGRTSTSYGSHNAWAGFFHFGPSAPYPVEDNYRSYLDFGQYINFLFVGGFASHLAGGAVQPYINKMRGIQMSMQGYASKWDGTDDALKQWDYTPPRIRESIQSLNPFAFGRWLHSGRGMTIFGKEIWGTQYITQGLYKLSQLNFYESSLERRQLAGLDFQHGLGQAPQDIFLTRKGVFMSARTDEENPGLSHSNYRKEIRMDAGMMEYLFRGQEATFLHDESARRYAMENTVRRNVSAEALAIRRNQELYNFGILQNSLWGWANPIAFLWHVPFPLYPPSWTPKDAITKFVGWAKHDQPLFSGSGFLRSFGHNVVAMQPSKLSMTTYCPRCSTPNFRGSRCRNCHNVTY